jgi:hypothetical protein
VCKVVNNSWGWLNWSLLPRIVGWIEWQAPMRKLFHILAGVTNLAGQLLGSLNMHQIATERAN